MLIQTPEVGCNIIAKINKKGLAVLGLGFVLNGSLACTKTNPDHSLLEKSHFVSLKCLEGSWFVNSRIPTWFDQKEKNISVDIRVKDFKYFDIALNYGLGQSENSGKVASLR